jgi:hypothetical protein
MLKKRLVVATLVLIGFVVFAAAPSQAAPRGWAAASRPAAAGLLTTIERWLSLLLNGGVERPEPSAIQQKNGCGIDPNGSPCGTGGGAGSGLNTALPDPADSGLN